MPEWHPGGHGLHGSRIVAVHADEVLPGRLGGTPALADEADVRRKIEDQVAELTEAGFAAELRIVGGRQDVCRLIAHAARDEFADLIVLGTHGYGGFKAALAGSVARGLLHEAPCPVLAIPPARATRGRGRVRETAAVG